MCKDKVLIKMTKDRFKRMSQEARIALGSAIIRNDIKMINQFANEALAAIPQPTKKE